MSDPPPELAEPFRRALLETIPCAVAIIDDAGRIIYWNRSAAELTGYGRAEALGATCEMMHVQLSAEQDPEMLRALCPAHDDAAADQLCQIRAKDGRVVPIVRTARPVSDEAGRRIGTIQAMMDISAFSRARAEIRTLQREIARAGRFGELVGSSLPMRRLYEAIEMVAPTDAGVVIEGETGTGKELVARTLHARSRRAKAVFLPVNCGALSETLLEAELFGHVRGAFTGAVADRAGRFEEASGGTLFLDEVGELSPASQVRLLRTVQEQEITRVGESRPRKVDVRVIAATNKDLAAEARAGRFREDLYYRLRVVGLSVPPLRERREDIPELAAHFIHRFNRKYARRIDRLSPPAMQRLNACNWPGNVRQLEHALEHAFVVTPSGTDEIADDALPPEIAPHPQHAARLAPPRAPAGDERSVVLEALAAAGGNKSQAARLLGVTRAGLYKKLKRLGID